MVVHTEGLTGIELQYAAQLTFQSVRGFENGGPHSSPAELALPAVEPTFPSSPRYHCFCFAAHVAFVECMLTFHRHDTGTARVSNAAPAGSMHARLVASLPTW